MMWRHTPMAIMSGNQKVAVAQAEHDHALDERGNPVDPRWRLGEQQVGTGEDGDGDGPGGDPRRGIGLGGLERREGPPQEDHGHDDEVEDEAEAEQRRGR